MNSWSPVTDHQEASGTVETDNNDTQHTTNGHAQGSHLHQRTHVFPPRTTSLHHRSHSADYNNDDDEATDTSRSPFSLAIRTLLLTCALTASFLLTLHLRISHPSSPHWRLPFFTYLLSQFHLLEYLSTAYANPSAATTSAFLLANGRAYNIAHLSAFAECFLHWTYFPQSHMPFAAASLALGLALLTLGQTTRTTAILTAGPSFTHLLAQSKLPHHKLITSGPYALLRHPSYFGFFYWGVGSQLVLGNHVCLVGYALVLWRFFRARVRVEEADLERWFVEEWKVYRGKVRWKLGIPFC